MLSPYRVLTSLATRLLRHHRGDLYLQVARSPETAQATAVTRVGVGKSNVTRYIEQIATSTEGPITS